MRANRVKQEIGVSPFPPPSPPPTSLPRGHGRARGEARDPISVRTSLPQTLQQQQDLARIVPVAGARLAVSPPSPRFPPPEPRYPIRDLWIIARLIPPARSKRESIAEDEDSIRFDDVSATSPSRTDLPISPGDASPISFPRVPEYRIRTDDNWSRKKTTLSKSERFVSLRIFSGA